MRKKLLKALHIAVLGFFVFSTVGVQVAMAAGTDGTMQNMEEGDIVDSSFTDGGTIKALRTDGTNERVTVSSVSSLKPENNFSFVGWYKFNTIDSLNGLAGDYNAEHYRWTMSVIGPSPAELRVMIASNGDPNIDKSYYSNTDEIVTSTWYQLGFTYSSNTLKLYKDGAEITNITIFNDETISVVTSTISSLLTLVNTSFDGDATNISFWDTAVLTESDFSELYNSGDGMDPGDLDPSGGANLISNWLWNTSLTYPTIPDNQAVVGGVPEFSTYMYILTIMTAFSFVYLNNKNKLVTSKQ